MVATRPITEIYFNVSRSGTWSFGVGNISWLVTKSPISVIYLTLNIGRLTGWSSTIALGCKAEFYETKDSPMGGGGR